MGDSPSLPWNLQKNRKLNWMMIVVVAEKEPLWRTKWNYRFKCDEQLTSHIIDAITHGCGAVSINLRSVVRLYVIAFEIHNCGIQQVALWAPVGSKMHRDSSICTALTGFSPLTTSLYSGYSARLSPPGFLALLIYTSLQATFTARTVQLYFQAH